MEQDKDLPAKLEIELAGILRWALQGCLDWQQKGLGEPSTVAAATNEYRAEMDALSEFISTCCVVNSRLHASAADLYAKYRHWAGLTGEDVLSQRAFGLRLREKGFARRRYGAQHAHFWFGIRLRANGEGTDSTDLTDPDSEEAGYSQSRERDAVF